MNNQRFIVSVYCRTFNQSNYIQNTLDGFCKQMTEFPYVCMIVDDASTDGEQDVINSYIEKNFIILNSNYFSKEETKDYVHYFVQNKINKNCYFAVYLLKYNHYRLKKSVRSYYQRWVDSSKYGAVCEGDDYWIDKKKIQKQVSFMESHPEYSMCFHAYKKKMCGKTLSEVDCHNFNMDKKCVELTYFLFPTMFVAPLTILYKNSARKDMPNWSTCAPVGDIPLQLVLASRGKVYYLDDVMGCYRMNSSASSFTSRTQNSLSLFNKYMIGMIRMHKSFDKWSEYKYHDAIKSKVRLEYKKIIKRNFSEIKKILKGLFIIRSNM